LQGKELAHHIAQLILDKKGYDVVILDLQGLTSATDYFVICSVDSDVQAKAIIGHVKDDLIYETIKPWHTEGTSSSNWILMDFVDVVVHVFHPETREFYSLERLWGDAQVTEIKDEDESTGIHQTEH